MKFLITILYLFSLSVAVAQKEASIWYFGSRAGVDFSSGSPVVLTDGALITEEGCASIADANGRLLFYTDGRQVYNKQKVLMKNGTGLNGSVSSTQSAVIIKSPGSDSIYYIFTVGAERQETGLCYSIVSLNRDNGLGEVIEKNTNLMLGVYEKIGAVNHCNKRDSWVVTRKFESDEYYSFLVDKNGVQKVPVLSRSGFNVGGVPVNSIGVLRFSNDGRKIAAIHSYETDQVELMDFDGLTGRFSNPKLLKANPGNTPSRSVTGAYGAEFSTDSRLLYVSWYSSVANKGVIAQFDVTAGTQNTIQSSMVKVAELDALPSAMQLGIDNKIYCSFWRENFLSVIHKPDVKGTNCDFRYQDLKLGEPGQRYCLGGLPSFLQSYFSPESLAFDFKRTGACSDRAINFSLNRTAGADSVRWNFGDPQSGAANVSTSFTPIHSYGQNGVYQVSLIVYKNDCTNQNDTIAREIWISQVDEDLLGPDRLICSGDVIEVAVPVDNVIYTWSNGSTSPQIQIDQSGLYWLEVNQQGCTERDSISVDFKPRPSVSLGRDTALCAGEQLLLDVTTPNAGYQWSTGAVTPSITVTNSGSYTVTVTVLGCSAADTIIVEPGSCKLYMPTAFTPNGDGLNDGFGMINTGAISAYRLEIYNRWGEQVFKTTNRQQRWDGQFKGKQAAPGSYIWILSYTKNNEPVPVNAKGTVQLIR
jgi:gliding motility-associated-like protein